MDIFLLDVVVVVVVVVCMCFWHRYVCFWCRSVGYLTTKEQKVLFKNEGKHLLSQEGGDTFQYYCTLLFYLYVLFNRHKRHICYEVTDSHII